MKPFRILLLLLALALPAAAADVAFTANLKNFSSNPTNSYLLVSIADCGAGNIPRVIGGGVKSLEKQKLLPDGTGKITTTITPNADITCGVSTGTTRYLVEVYQRGESGLPDKRVYYAYYTVFAATPFLLESAVPNNAAASAVVPTAVLTNPAGTQTIATYALIVPGGVTAPLTGNVTGNVTGAVTGNASTASALAANGANCAAGSVAAGVDAAGAAEGCIVAASANTASAIVQRDASGDFSARIASLTRAVAADSTLYAFTSPTFGFSLNVGAASFVTTINAAQSTRTHAANFETSITAGSTAGLYGLASLLETEGAFSQSGDLAALTVESYPHHTGSLGNVRGAYIAAYPENTGAVTQSLALSLEGYTGAGGLAGSVGGLQTLASLYGAGSATELFGVKVRSNTDTGAGSVTTNYGIVVEDQAIAGAANYALYTGIGAVRFGDNVTLDTGKTITAPGGFVGNSSTATALAANGANCAAGSLAAGVDAGGVAEGCIAATNLNTASAIVQRDASGNFSAGAITSLAVNAAYNTAQYASLQAAITAAGSTGKVVLPCGTYTTLAGITIATDSASIEGYGPCSIIDINHTSDFLTVTGSLFNLRNLRLRIATATTRAGAALLNIQNSQGTLTNVLISGNASSPNNGMMFKQEADAADNWSYRGIRFTSGTTWTSAWRMSTASGTIASTKITDAGGGLIFTAAAFDLDGAVDTVQIALLDLPAQGGSKVFRLQNTVGAAMAPRWVQCMPCSIEAAGGTAIDLVASRNFTYHGYVATSTFGAVVGAGAANTDLSAVQFVNIGRNAVTIKAGSFGTEVANNFFDDTGNETNNTYDTIAVEAGASDFKISGNRWRQGATNQPRYAVGIAAGATNNFTIKNNTVPTAARGTGTLNNGATGAVYDIWNNTGTGNSTANGVGSTFADLVTASAGVRANSGSCTTPSMAFTAATNYGIYYNSGGPGLGFCVNGTERATLTAGILTLIGGAPALKLTGDSAIVSWGSASDAGISRTAASALAIGNGSVGNASGTLSLSKLTASTRVTEGVNSVTFSATPTFDSALGNTQQITLTGNVTSSTLSSLAAGQQIDFIICQDATGSRTFVWPTNVSGGMTIGATASRCSAQSFRVNAAGTKAYATSSGVINML